MENTIEIKNEKYGIIDQFDTTDFHGDKSFEVIKTSCSKEEEFFAWYPIWINGKFRFLKTVLIRKRLFLYRSLEFNDGWTYQHYWSPWVEDWRFEEILS